MITHLNISSFKSLLEFDQPIRPLTVFTGLNSSGKSTILQAVRMLNNVFINHEPFIEKFGSYDELIYKSQTSGISYVDKDINITARYLGEYDLYLTIDEEGIPNFQNGGDLFFSLSYLSADRLGPQLHLPISYKTPNEFDVGEKGQYVADCLFRFRDSLIPESLQHKTSQGETLSYNVQAWLDIISPGFELSAERYSKQDISCITFNDFRPMNVGFGLSYTLPVIVSLLGLPAIELEDEYTGWRVLLLENPEAHLHPKGQTELGKLIACSAAAGLQIFVETHSDYIIDGIRLGMLENLIPSEDVIFLHCSISKDRVTEVEQIIPNSHGKLSRWPADFFDQNRINKAKLAGIKND